MADKVFAIEYVCAKRMHQSFTIPGTETNQPLKVTYATAGLEDDDAPTIVFISGMFGMRWLALLQHHLALKVGVRLVCVDRPGFGGSTLVPLSERISTWLLTVRHLMAHLKCKHVIPIGTSAGTHYLLNTLYYLPSILPLQTPYSALLAPWIHPKHSQSTTMSFLASDWMPKSLVQNHWNEVSGFFATRFLPSLATSGGLMESFMASSPSFSRLKTKRDMKKDEDNIQAMEVYGMTLSQKEAVSKLGLKYMFAESTTGANDEALLCLKKGPESDVSWAVCDDVQTFVPKLAEEWKRYRAGIGQMNVKLRVQVVFAASDNMSGLGGQSYFEQCWEKGNGEGVIDYEGSVAENTTHDSIGDPEVGLMEAVLREGKKALSFQSIDQDTALC